MRYAFKLVGYFGVGVLIAVAFAFLVTAANAADVTVSWTKATQRVDGTTLPESEVERYVAEYGSCSAPNVFGNIIGSAFAAGSTNSLVISGLGAGSQYCFRMYTEDTDELMSDASATATTFIQNTQPNAPSNVQVTVN